MFDKIVRMPPPVYLTDEDLDIAETACRANAARVSPQRRDRGSGTLGADSR
jgi:hypothetical protein